MSVFKYDKDVLKVTESLDNPVYILERICTDRKEKEETMLSLKMKELNNSARLSLFPFITYVGRMHAVSINLCYRVI